MADVMPPPRHQAAPPVNATVSVDSVILRKALRLVHCIQRERGASCALNPAKPLVLARRDTDRAFAMLLQDSNVSERLSVEQVTLEKVRKMVLVDDSQQGYSGEAVAVAVHRTSLHQILVSFNTLIQSIVHEYVLRYTEVAKHWSELSQNIGKPGVSMKMTRSGSYQALQQTVVDIVSPLRHRHKRTFSTGAHPIMLVASSDPEDYRRGKVPPPPLETSGPPGSVEEVELQDSMPDYLEDDDDEERVMRLLTLLDTFVRLKESTGVERATLSSILGQLDSRFMLNDLVLQVENQRRQVGNLERMLPRTGVWHDLVSELVSFSPKMKRLQDSILKVDLESFRSTFDSQGELWNLLTLYINKLHSLELLVVEEIENCAGAKSQDGRPLVIDSKSSKVLPDSVPNSWNDTKSRFLVETFGLSESGSIDDFRKHIETMSPEEVRRRLLLSISSGDDASKDPQGSDGGMADAAAVAGTSVDELLAELSLAPASKEWEIGLYEISFVKRIGEGAAGTTYLADWSGLTVAVKVASISEMGLDGWRTEVQQLQKLHHPNIIRLLGSVYHPSPLTFCLVLEYCEAGDLSTALQRVAPPNFFFHIAESISKGMAYLHSRNVIHRDIKPENILLEGDVGSGHFNVKVTDFGVATEASLTGNRTAETGTYRWMAPEVIRHESYGPSADVYSSAVVMWQLITREEPFHRKSQIEAAAAAALENARPPFPDKTPTAIVKLIATCWSVDPDERHSFDEVILELQEIKKWLNLIDKTWIEAPLGHSSIRVPKATSEHKELDISHVVGQPPAPPEGKKKKGFRTLFNRKSAYF